MRSATIGSSDSTTVAKSAWVNPSVLGSMVARESAAIVTSRWSVGPDDGSKVRWATVSTSVGLRSAIVVSKKPLTAPSAKNRRKRPPVATKGWAVTSACSDVTLCDAGANVKPARLGVSVRLSPGARPVTTYCPPPSVVVTIPDAPDDCDRDASHRAAVGCRRRCPIRRTSPPSP